MKTPTIREFFFAKKLAVLTILKRRGEIWMLGIDKIYHLLFYGTIALVLGTIACQLSPRGQYKSRLMGLGTVLLWIGILDEYRQFLDPRRDTEWLDGAANLVGVILGLGIPYFLYGKTSTPARIRWRVIFPVMMLWLFLFFGLHFLTSVGPAKADPFFPQGSTAEGSSQFSQSQAVMFRISPEQRGIALLREKYLSQFLFVEQEYQEELKPLISYMISGNEVLHHLWLMKLLDDATDDQINQILQDMKKTVESERLSEKLLDQVENECMQRKRTARANMLKQAIIRWRQQSYGSLP